MAKILEKALKDAVKEDKCILGAHQVLKSLKNSKLVVLSDSVRGNELQNIEDGASKEKIPTVKFEGNSIALGKLCGLQFRVSTVSFNSISEANIKSIMKEAEKVN